MKRYFKNKLRDTLGFFYYNAYLKYCENVGNRVLIYHAFGSNLKHDTYGFSIDLHKFEEQIKFYKDNYKIININDYKNNNIDTLSITIDDGYKDNIAAIDILNKYDIPFSLYVTTNTLNTAEYLSSDDVKSLSCLSNCEIGSHCYDHIRLDTLSNEKILYQLSESKRILENIISCRVIGISYPYGSYNEYVLNALETIGYDYAACSIKGKNTKETSNYLLRRSEVVQSDSLSTITNKINGYYDFY